MRELNVTPDLSGRGRNGWFDLVSVCVLRNAASSAIEFRSRRQGSLAPIIIEGPAERIRTVLLQTAGMLNGKGESQ